MSGWWYRATAEQKLAQIDAAIEIGMTAKQVAMNCGVDLGLSDRGYTVQSFATYHGRAFSQADDYKRRLAATRRHKRKAGLDAAKQAYFRGEPVDVWSVK